jgi:hypothetical protein
MDGTGTTRRAIARIWRGRTIGSRADEYAEYLYEHGLRPVEQKALIVGLPSGRTGELPG